MEGSLKKKKKSCTSQKNLQVLSPPFCLLQTPAGTHQRPGHPQRHVAHLQNHAWLCQVGNFFYFFRFFSLLILLDAADFEHQCVFFSYPSALTLEDEKRSLAQLIIGFIRMVRLLRPLLSRTFSQRNSLVQSLSSAYKLCTQTICSHREC